MWSECSLLCFLLQLILSRSENLTVDAFFTKRSSGEDRMMFELVLKWINDDLPLNNEFFKVVPRENRLDHFDSFNMTKTVCRLMENGVGALLGPKSSETFEIMKSLSQNYHIPLINTFPEYSTDEKSSVSSINLYPDYKIFAKGLLAIVEDMDWKTFAIVYEDVDSLIRLQEVLKWSERGKKGKITFTTWKLQGEDYRPMLKSMKSETRIILDCSNEKVLEVLKQAKEVNMMGDYHRYVITSLDVHTLDFEDLNLGQTNITTIRLIDTGSYNVQKTIYDFTHRLRLRSRRFRPETMKVDTALIYDGVDFLSKSLKSFWSMNMTLHQQWLSCRNLTRFKYGQAFGRVMKKMDFKGLTGRAKFDKRGRRIFFTLHITELTKGGYRKIGTWDPENGITYKRSIYEMDQDMFLHISNKTFIVVSRIGQPYLSYNESLNGNDRFQGYSKDLIDEIAKELNFKYNFVLAPDGEYGSYNPEKKQWNGLIRELQERRADLAICDLTITYERRRAVDFTMPFMSLGISILYSKPVEQPPNLFSFSEPMSFDVWVCMGTAFLAVSLLLYILGRITPGEWQSAHPCRPSPTELVNNLSMANVFWHNCGSLMQQGSDISAKAFSTRMVCALWWFYILIMISSYTANLTAFLTYVRMEGTIKSVEDLATSNKIKYGVVEGGASMNFFKNNNVSLYKRMWGQMESSRPSVFAKTNDEGVDRVLKGNRKYAFFMESTTIEYQMEKYCNLTQVGGLLDSKDYGIAMPLYSPYRIAISTAVLKLQESGQLAKLKEKWWKVGKCGETSAKSDDLGMANVGGVFLVLLYGCVGAIFQAIIEFLWNVRRVAVREEISLKEAFSYEWNFLLNCFSRVKPVRFKIE